MSGFPVAGDDLGPAKVVHVREPGIGLAAVLVVDNVARLRTKVVLQGANIPITPGAERALAAKGVLVMPDFVVNARGDGPAALRDPLRRAPKQGRRRCILEPGRLNPGDRT